MIEELTARLHAGDRRALARFISLLEAEDPAARAALRELRRSTGPGQAHVLGVTGPPGSGKSTLIARLARLARTCGRRTGILAIDPTSPFSGGAFLGDRVRMQELAVDPGIFVRSMATRGATGGLARATDDAAAALQVAGMDLIFIETVGTGQDEIDVISSAETVLLVHVPGLGDAIQTIKAGIIEIADVHVVNKADQPGADRLVAELRATLPPAAEGVGWHPPVLKVSALEGRGIEAVAEALEAHRRYLQASGERERRRRAAAERRVLDYARELLLRELIEQHAAELAGLVEAVLAGEEDVHSAARRLIARTQAKK